MSGRLPPEASLFARMAAFGLVAGGGYGLLTGETAGTVMLGAFGIASLVAAIAVFVGLRAAGHHAESTVGGATAAEPAGPRPGWAPVLVALGLGGVALGLAFGPWLSIGGILVAARSAKLWLDATIDEAGPPGGGGR